MASRRLVSVPGALVAEGGGAGLMFSVTVSRIARPGTLGGYAVREVSDSGSSDDLDGLELDGFGPEVIEQANTTAEKHRDQVDVDLVEQPRPQALLCTCGAHDTVVGSGYEAVP
jgi:hypothetical protein